jgi:monofunctional biosynthetic peptidoglycan transglycosylase
VAAKRRGRLGLAAIAWKAFSYTLGGLVIAFLLAQLWFYGHVFYWMHYPPGRTAFMEHRLDGMLETNPKARLQYQWVPYERISANLKRAVVAAEDAKFLDHEGFDWEAIQKAIAKNERRGHVVAGASTISQQLAKNLFLSGERSWLRKGQEAIITWMLETELSKRRILELYLNVAEWGEPGIFGAEAAARYHFGIPAASLDANQAAWLAVILPSPRRYAHGRMTPYLAARVDTIRARMGSVQIPGSSP